jgi:hypothetical protein
VFFLQRLYVFLIYFVFTILKEFEHVISVKELFFYRLSVITNFQNFDKLLLAINDSFLFFVVLWRDWEALIALEQSRVVAFSLVSFGVMV